MIHLANDPNAARTSFRPAPAESKAQMADRRSRTGGHAWPFLSRSEIRSRPADQQKPTARDSGS